MSFEKAMGPTCTVLPMGGEGWHIGIHGKGSAYGKKTQRALREERKMLREKNTRKKNKPGRLHVKKGIFLDSQIHECRPRSRFNLEKRVRTGRSGDNRRMGREPKGYLADEKIAPSQKNWGALNNPRKFRS